jgi:DnaK suppressor protein
VARDLEELREIRLARQRISDGCYGTCLDCGVDIDLARLLAQPHASRCVSCEEEAEQASGTATDGGRRARRA